MFSKFFTSLASIYESMSLKRFHIEQLCPSIDSMNTCFCTLCHYVMVNLNINENRMQFVQCKMDDPPRVTQYTVQELSDCKHSTWRKKSVTIIVKRNFTLAWNQGFPCKFSFLRQQIRHLSKIGASRSQQREPLTCSTLYSSVYWLMK